MVKVPDVMWGNSIISNLKGVYNGIPVNSLEYSALERLILLLDLRNLCLKKMGDDVLIVEINEQFNFDILKEECPDHYSNLLEVESMVLNIEKIKEKYLKYYDFILTFESNEITIENFKEIYSEIIQLMRSNISALIQARKKVKWNIENDVIDENEKVIIPKKIIWNKKSEELENLFQNLAAAGYVDANSITNLQSHFSISDLLTPVKSPEKNFKRIVWKESNVELGVFFDHLVLKGYVKFYRGNINKAMEDHFQDEDGKRFENMGQTRSNTNKTEKSHSELINLINSSF
ncbi:MAG: hypothetical protein K1X86_00085 [Ignavibacteria bacterium]|nr:hypothetical protein [Ignavibacteria bacterium]